MSRKKLACVVLLMLTLVLLVASAIVCEAVTMPGRSFSGAAPPLTASELDVEAGLRRHLAALAGTIGERNMQNLDKLNEASEYIKNEFTKLGYEVKIQEYLVDAKPVRNLEVELPGAERPDEIVVIGAHYDSVPNCAGANDNASGVAGVLELARLLRGRKLPRTLRFLAFTDEEDPYFYTTKMGSYQYAKRCHDRHEKIVGMLAVETYGYYSDAAGSQKLPPFANLVYPTKGNFLWFVSDQTSKPLLETCIGTFRKETSFPSQGVAAPDWIEGTDWCDQIYFWEFGYPGLMITDSAPYRYPYYHKPEDTIDKLNFPCMARVIKGLSAVVDQMCAAPSR